MTATVPTPPLVRRRNGRVIAGVAGGIADHLGVDVAWVRIVLAVLAVLGGAGVVAYGLLWVFVRQERGAVSRVVSRAERQQALGLVALSIAAALVSSALGSAVIGWIIGPLGFFAIGAAVVWREADAPAAPMAAPGRTPVAGRAATARRRMDRDPGTTELETPPSAVPSSTARLLPTGVAVAPASAEDTRDGGAAGNTGDGGGAGDAAVVDSESDDPPIGRRRWARFARPAAVLRVLAGAVFVVAGIGAFLLGNVALDQLRFGLLAVLATLVGVAVLTLPWWVRLVRDLGEERRGRIVAAERAEIAAHLHDSVLQTLALIQRQSDQPREVLRLARGQERELRGWLYGPGGYYTGAGVGGGAVLDAGLTEALGVAAAEVEDTYAVSVRPVVVGGDLMLDDGLRALVLAAREAMVNAAKHAGVAEVSVFAEVEGAQVHVFVRDRGTGFEPTVVPPDRHGLADSVHARMARHGGTVGLRSAPGEGTEVHLTMPTNGAARTVPAQEETAR